MLPSIISKVASVKISRKEGTVRTPGNDDGDDSDGNQPSDHDRMTMMITIKKEFTTNVRV